MQDRIRTTRISTPPRTAPWSTGVKAITLWQPWASLMAAEVKRIETRSWRTTHRGPLVIHAAKSTPAQYWKQARDLPVLNAAMERAGLDWDELPRARVLCLVNLLGCVPTTQLHKAEFLLGSPLGAIELACGNYAPGRYAWVTQLADRIDDPGPTAGKQGMWTWLRGGKARGEKHL